MNETIALLLAYLLDLVMGDPKWIPHPVQFIGRAIEKIENLLREQLSVHYESRKSRKDNNDDNRDDTGNIKQGMNIFDLIASFSENWKNLSMGRLEKVAGTLLAVVIAGAVYLLFSLLSRVLLYSELSAASYILSGIFIYLLSTTIATRELISSAQAVIQEIKIDNLENSRKLLSMIVGRDTSSLKEEGVLRAAIETLAENASDAIVAPIFYFVIGGLPLAMMYKAINTLDSMVGYKNDKYIHFGWASARLDDIANYIPARITALLIVASAYLITSIRYAVSEGSYRLRTVKNKAGMMILSLLRRFGQEMGSPGFQDAHNAFRIMMRDGKKHPSPNSGYPEAAMAGALGVQLGGPSTYVGEIVNKPHIGDEIKIAEGWMQDRTGLYMKAALSALTLTKLTSFLALFAAVLVL